MNWLDFWGHVGYIFIVLGMILIAKKSFWGWALRAVGELCWLGIGLWMGMSSIYVWGTIFLLIDIKAFLNWRKDNKAS